MDGTFKVVPRIYSQLFTIHGLYRGFCIPLVYCLLPDKRRETYYEVFDTLRRKMAETNLVLNPTKLMLDFESGLLPALRTQFPNATIKGCYFHYTKAIWSHVQDLGLVTDYNDNKAVKKTIRMLMSLAFLPRPLVRPNFFIIEGSNTVLNSDKLQTLCNYFKETWLNGPFDIWLWNVNQETLRTNNLVEGWHNRLNRSVGKHHPNLFELITNLKKEQYDTELTISRARLGAATTVRRRKYRELETRIVNLTEQHRTGGISTREFLKNIRHVAHHF